MSEIRESKLPPKAYLATLKSTFGFPLAVYSERVTGVVIGKFFSVAYYAPWEWNRRITSECNRALGYVKDVDGKSEIHFIRSAGMMSPFWFLFWTMICVVWAYINLEEISLFTCVLCAAIAFAICFITAFIDTLTEAGAEGAGVITSLIEKPDEFYYC